MAGVTVLTQSERVMGANDRVRVAVVGLRGWGFEHVEQYAAIPGVEIAAVCDVDENILRKRLADISDRADVVGALHEENSRVHPAE